MDTLKITIVHLINQKCTDETRQVTWQRIPETYLKPEKVNSYQHQGVRRAKPLDYIFQPHSSLSRNE